VSQRLIQPGEQSLLQTHIATTSDIPLLLSILAILLSQRDAARCNHCFRHENDPPRKRFTNTVLAVLGLHSCSSSRLQTSQHEIRPPH
jgi:hypothetical protein